MTITNPSPTRAPFDQEKVRSKAVLSIDWTRGVATAITGQGATVTRAGNAFVTAGNGVLTRIGTNRPRLLHFVGANGGLLTEGARTNLALRSNEFDDAAWTKSNLTVTANQAIAPDGSLSGDLFTDGNSSGRIQQTVTVAAGATATYSVWLRRSNQDWVRVQMFQGANGFRAWFNLATGAVGTSSVFGTGVVTAARITAFPGGWYRCSVTGSLPGETSYIGWIVGAIADGSNDTATSAQRFAWGAQAEVGPFPSTYTPTVAATVTRPTDQIFYTDFPQPAEIAARGGITVYHRFVEQGTRDTASARYFQVGAGGVARFVLGTTSAPISQLVVLSNGTSTSVCTIATQPAISNLVECLAGLEYRDNAGTPEFRATFTQSINGGAPIVATPGSWISAVPLIANGWPTAPTLHIGARDGGGDAGFALHQALKARFGIHDLASMRTLV